MQYEWDKAAEQRLFNLKDEYAIPVLCGSVWASSALKAGDLDTFIEYLLNVPRGGLVHKFTGGIVGAMNTFCHVCLVDPHLAEAYVGMTFAEVAEVYE